MLTSAMESRIGEEELAAEGGAVDPPLRTREELAYYRIWREHLDGIAVERNLPRFATA